MSSSAEKAAAAGRIAGQAESAPVLESEHCAGEREQDELDGRRTFFRLRKHWSIAVIMWISSFIAFHVGLTIGLE